MIPPQHLFQMKNHNQSTGNSNRNRGHSNQENRFHNTKKAGIVPRSFQIPSSLFTLHNSNNTNHDGNLSISPIIGQQQKQGRQTLQRQTQQVQGQGRRQGRRQEQDQDEEPGQDRRIEEAFPLLLPLSSPLSTHLSLSTTARHSLLLTKAFAILNKHDNENENDNVSTHSFHHHHPYHYPSNTDIKRRKKQ